jgi:hypothetical protein
MGFYRPSCRVRLQLRVDEMADTAALEGGLELNPPSGPSFGEGLPATQAGAREGLDSVFSRRETLEQNRANLPTDELARERALLNRERGALQTVVQKVSTQNLPDVVDPDKGVKDGLTVIFDVLPQQVTVERNAMKDADTAKITLDFRDVPVDPRVVRACFVSISIGTAGADEYEAGMAGKRREDGSLRSLVARESGEELRLDSDTRFTGFVDVWRVEYREDGDTVELECRDVSAVLRDQRFYSQDGRAQTVDLNKPIAEGIQKVVDQFPSTRGIKVVFGTPVNPDDPLAVLTPDFGPTPSGIMPRTRKSKKGKQVKAQPKVLNQSVWDHVTDVVLRLGLVPVLRGFTLFLLEPRVLFADLTAARRMVWGRNIKTLRVARKLGGIKTDTIEVRSYDATIGRTRWARYPVLQGEPTSGILGQAGSPQPTATRANNVGPTGKADESVRVLSVPAVSDLKTLERVAESVFNEIGRQEIEGELETDDFESFDSQEEADLLRLLPGEPVQVLVALPVDTGGALSAPSAEKPARASSSLQELTAQSVAARADYLASLGMSQRTAERLAIAQEKVRLISTFRVSKVAISWDTEDGVSLAISFYNFIVVREAPNDATGGNAAQPSLDQRVAARQLQDAEE